MTARAQLIKLSRTLGVPVEELDYLAAVPDADLIAFRMQVADWLFEGQVVGLRKVAAAAKVIPTPIIAKLIMRNRNALLAAKTASVLDPSHARDVAKRLPADFLADIAAQLDAHRSAPIIGRLPETTVVAVSAELERRADWLTLGNLMTTLSERATRVAQAELGGDALVQAAYLVDGPDLTRVIGLISEPKLIEMVEAVAERDLWEEYRAVLAALPESALERLRTATEHLPTGPRERALDEIGARRTTG
ncbi:hypothetical protein [Nocardia sp. NPDC050710]|uniref:hypothetical protein n=1 Tax=Nocardia sp. NPDC050710 TaxID=3157220 RepID=UPI0033EEAFEB